MKRETATGREEIVALRSAGVSFLALCLAESDAGS